MQGRSSIPEFVVISLLPWLLAACADGNTRFEPRTAAASRTDAGGSAAPALDGADSGSAAREPAAPDIDFGVRFVGRVDATDEAGARFAWSGSGFVARFSGSRVAARFNAGHHYTVVIDGEVLPKYVATGGSDPLAEGLGAGEHVLEVYRRTEANLGESVFHGLDAEDGALLEPPAPPERRIEIVGDSITCGYGNEGADMNCGFSPDTENHHRTYGAIAARALGAELSTVAWSGKGVVCNYGDDASSCTNPLPAHYDRTLPGRAESRWDFSRWQADAVVVNLGTNDFSTSVDPTREEFVAAYAALLATIRGAYPNAFILCTIGPMLSGGDLSTAREAIAAAVAERAQAGDQRVTTFELPPQDGSNGYGCDWHPSLATHELMATRLTEVLREALGWD